MPRRHPLTLAEALDDWLEGRSAGRGLSPNTIRAYRRDIAAVAEQLVGRGSKDEPPAPERMLLTQLTPEAVVTALAGLQQQGAAPATRARIHGTLAALCAHLVRQRILRTDPMAAASLERPKQPPSLPRYIERDDEFARVLAAAGTPDENGRHVWPERDIALAAVLAGTGVRRASCAACASAISFSTSKIRTSGSPGRAVRSGLSPPLGGGCQRHRLSRQPPQAHQASPET